VVCAVAVNTLSGRSGMVTRAVLPVRGSALRRCGMPTMTRRLRTSDTTNGSAPAARAAHRGRTRHAGGRCAGRRAEALIVACANIGLR
jgi:hypothetical protein